MNTQTNELKTADFDYYLPQELIAQNPLSKRENCAMMHLNKKTKEIEHLHFYNILDYLNKDDILVLNDTKVYSARIIAQRQTGANVEVFLLNPCAYIESQLEQDYSFKGYSSIYWEALTKNAKRVKEGEVLFVASDFRIKLIKKQAPTQEQEIPKYVVELIFKGDNIYNVLDKYGSIPLPPYINRKTKEEDKENYQTVFAKNIGSAACPTAGLHFSNELLEKIKQKGVRIAYVTLNVGLGTFMPIKVDEIEKHTMHYESYTIPKETQDLIENKKGAVIAVGTTVLRCLEAQYQKHGRIVAGADKTNIFIYPPYKIKSIDKLITNFHLPKSTLIMLVSAFCSKEFILEAYKQAVEKEYRFFSYGDCMFIE